MEHRVLHMSVHCRTGMHESTRKSTRFRRQLWLPHLPVWDYHGSASVLVWLWWLEQSSHDVDFQLLTFFLHLHKLCCKLCCQLCCTDYICIIQFYSSYICHLKNNNRLLKNQADRQLKLLHETRWWNWNKKSSSEDAIRVGLIIRGSRHCGRFSKADRLSNHVLHALLPPGRLKMRENALKIDFDTDLTPNITRHSCIISAELVVSSFVNNLVRLSSIVPFHIIYQVNLYWRNNSAHKYNYFETLWLSILTFPAFSTTAIWSRIFMSRIFHPCKLVPQIHVSHFQVLHFWPSRIFMSRIFSHPLSTSVFIFSLSTF